jgi:hypothetical protein
MTKTFLERLGTVNKVRSVNNPLDPGQPIDLHPHVQSIAESTA